MDNQPSGSGRPFSAAKNHSRTFSTFRWKEALYRISSDKTPDIHGKIRELREIIERWIDQYPLFGTSFGPVDVPAGAPEVIRRMSDAAKRAGVGPMAAVAGTIAQMSAEHALKTGAREAIVDNGGDIFLISREPVTAGLYIQDHPLENRVAFRIDPGIMPLGLCSSSGRMGHSVSLGKCDCATVFSKSCSLADAAATRACNLVTDEEDLLPVSELISALPGITGVLLVKNEKIAMAGDVPPLVKPQLCDMSVRVTHHELSNFKKRL